MKAHHLFALAFFFVAVVVGCAGDPLDGARRALGAVVETYTTLEPPLEARRRADGARCLELHTPADEACLVQVRAAWEPRRRASEALYGAIVTAVATLHAAEAAQALGQPVDASVFLPLVLDAVRASDAFRRAVRPEPPVAPLPPSAPAQAPPAPALPVPAPAPQTPPRAPLPGPQAFASPRFEVG